MKFIEIKDCIINTEHLINCFKQDLMIEILFINSYCIKLNFETTEERDLDFDYLKNSLLRIPT